LSPAEKSATIVVDLGYGDSGKGAVTDFLVRDRSADTVVRFNGGAQAGHNVVTPDGRHHTFAQFGAGTFVRGTSTHLAKTVVVHPTGLLVEAEALARVGVTDALARLTVHQDALVTTPFHQAANRLRELLRGPSRHGSCGIGFGETVRDALASPAEAVRARHWGDTKTLRRLVGRARDRLRADLGDSLRESPLSDDARLELDVFESPNLIDAWIEAVAPVASQVTVVDDGWLSRILERPGHIVFEGAQGVLLDEDRGFHPFTTWSHCTFDAALRLLEEQQGYGGRVTRLGVLRTYAVRHGPGPFPTQTVDLAGLPEPHNAFGPWQREFRVGWPDMVATRYALSVSQADAIAVTHLDALERVAQWKVCRGYDGSPAGDTKLRASPVINLEHQAAITEWLLSVRPRLEPFRLGADADKRWTRFLAEELAVPVRLGFWGKATVHGRWLDPPGH
jgi:adenylosuccinate synthase